MTKFLRVFTLATRKTLGIGLVLAATSGTALAQEPTEVPEIDSGSLVGAATLLAGGILILCNRSRRPAREASSSS